AQFVDRWDPTVQIHDDEIDGRFHSNSEIYIEHSGGVHPVFHGMVTVRAVDTSKSTRRVPRRDVFVGGLETRAGRIALPRRFLPLDELGHGDGPTVRWLDEDTRIVFRGDGSYALGPLGSR